MRNKINPMKMILVAGFVIMAFTASTQRQMEKINRGLIAVWNNGSKATPAISADLFGDWREEVVWRTSDNKELRIYTTIIPTHHRFYTLMHDPVYRLGIAWQNVAYNQPPHVGYYLGAGMDQPKRPAIFMAPR